jgi:hypothetical protein
MRNSYFSVTLRNMHQLHFFCKKVQLHFSVRKVQLVAVVLFLKLGLHFSEMTEKKISHATETSLVEKRPLVPACNAH